MQRKFFKLKIFLISLAVLFLGLGAFSLVHAGWIPIDDAPCTNNQFCFENFGGGECRQPPGAPNKACYQRMSPTDIENIQNDIKNGATNPNVAWWTDEVRQSIIGSLTLDVTGEIPIDGTAYKPGGAIGFVSQGIVALYTNPPASGIEYFADLGKNLGIVKPAYAQGLGFIGLAPLLPIWKASRNLAYIFLILVFLAMGLAIMLRVKISPQAVITIQEAFPKLIISMVLITFSYAIAGLLIDLMYLIIRIAVLVIWQSLPNGWLNGLAFEQAKYSTLTFGDAIATTLGGSIKAIGSILGMVIGVFGEGLLLVVAIGQLAQRGLPKEMKKIATPLFVFSVIILYAIFKLFLNLLSCYVNIILAVIFGPLKILLGTFPGGKNNGFSDWFKNLLANVLAFPAVAILVLISWIISNKAGPNLFPPVLGPQISGVTPAITSFGILLLLHKVPDMIKLSLGIKPQDLQRDMMGIVSGGYNAFQLGKREYEKYTGADIQREGIRKTKAEIKGAEWRASNPGWH